MPIGEGVWVARASARLKPNRRDRLAVRRRICDPGPYHGSKPLLLPRRRPNAAPGPDHRRRPPRHGRTSTAAATRSWSAQQSCRATYRELWDVVDASRPRPPRRSASPPATASASGRPTASSGSSSSTPPPASAPSWSTSTPPTRPPSWSTPCASPASGLLFHARGFRQNRLRPAARRRPAALPRPEARRPLRRGLARPSSRPASRSPRPSWTAARQPCSSTTRSTSSTPPARPASPRAPR